MCVCVQPPHVDCVPCFPIENASKRLDYPALIYRGAVLAFCRCCNPTGRWLAALKADKHDLIKEPFAGAVFKSVARRTARPATNAVRVCGLGGIVQLMCAWRARPDASSTYTSYRVLDGQKTWRGLGASLNNQIAWCQGQVHVSLSTKVWHNANPSYSD